MEEAIDHQLCKDTDLNIVSQIDSVNKKHLSAKYLHKRLDLKLESPGR